MKISIICIGSLKKSPELDLINLYLKRFEWGVDIHEISVKRSFSGKTLQDEEGKRLLQACPPGAYRAALDARGQAFNSEDFAQHIQHIQQRSFSKIAFLIGGAAGHGDKLKLEMHGLLSLGPMTWPHMLVRVMLVEQLYRAQQIQKGHPYHRS